MSNGGVAQHARRWLLAAAGAAFAAGCSPASSVSVTQVAPGANGCPSGGVLISNGSSGQVICNGSSGAVAGLIAHTTQLAPGDPNCAAGGKRIDFARDVNGSGVFDAANVVPSMTMYDCNAAGSASVGSLTPPASPKAAFSIRAAGGKGTAPDTGIGGAGGTVDAHMKAGTAGGHVKVFRTGAADGTAATPAAPALDLGAVPLHVTAGATLRVTAQASDSCAALPPGDVYYVFDDGAGPPLLRHCAPGGPETVTGLAVDGGATLTFVGQTCAPDGTFPGTACARMTLDAQCHNAGTITVDATRVAGALPARLDVVCGTTVTDPGSLISVAGAPGAPGGFVTLAAREASAGDPLAGIAPVAAGALWNGGAIDVSGGAGTGGGAGRDAGAVTLSAGLDLYTSGAIRATGGTAAGAAGGKGGTVTIGAAQGRLVATGTVDASGGAGDAAGAGGSISIAVAGAGSLRTAARLVASGGSAGTTCTAGCAGGDAGAIVVHATNGDLVSSGALVATGGAGGAGLGGNGGSIQLKVDTGAASQGGNALATGSLWMSGDVDASGGDGANGGNGGALALSLDPLTAPAAQEIVLFGYSSVDVHGGDGAATGGDGGAVTLQQDEPAVAAGASPGGAVACWADVVATGGNGGGLSGANGGTFTLRTQSSGAWSAAYAEVALSFGALQLSAGAGVANGGLGGTVDVYGRTGAENGGAIVATGGAATLGTGRDGGTCTLASDAGEVWNHGAIHLDGGAGGTGAEGGFGGRVVLQGATVKNEAALTAIGGTASGGGAFPGSGGTIVMAATSSPVTNSATTLDVHGGSPTDLTLAGVIVIDGAIVTSQWTH